MSNYGSYLEKYDSHLCRVDSSHADLDLFGKDFRFTDSELLGFFPENIGGITDGNIVYTLGKKNVQ